ncbi:MAG: hypothetical protein BJ554DRAFT_1246 [Olpidium bornovanus]|uniref:Uncharacterized protein n=1 Tax=Olpidium bornovanus TaxID=278681 RepID=A0A8H7ZSK5_9FUNG|nr:MAG: hypothetical protein BJ554DRAFT_1246 [Olpidium bornovanus]
MSGRTQNRHPGCPNVALDNLAGFEGFASHPVPIFPTLFPTQSLSAFQPFSYPNPKLKHLPPSLGICLCYQPSDIFICHRTRLASHQGALLRAI